MTLFFYILIGLITFVAFLHAWSRKDYNINRTVLINAPKAEVYAYIRQLKKQDQWMPWFKDKPGIVLKFKGEDGKPGASSYWKGRNRIGEGEGIQRIIKIRDGKVVEFQILLLKPYKTLSMSYAGVKEVNPERSRIVWGFRGGHRFPATVVMLFYGLDRAVGREIEDGLSNLKAILEKNRGRGVSSAMGVENPPSGTPFISEGASIDGK